MKRHFIWFPNADRGWQWSFLIPSLPWMKPYLKFLNLPEELFPLTREFQEMYEEIKNKYESNLNERVKNGIPYSKEWDSSTTEEIISVALKKLVSLVGKRVVNEFVDWAIRNIIINQSVTAYQAWDLFMIRMVYHKKSSYSNPALNLNDLENILKYPDRDRIEKELLEYVSVIKDAPEYIEEGWEEDDLSPFGLTILLTIKHETVRSALYYIATHLDDAGREEFIKQAKIEREIIGFYYEEVYMFDDFLKLAGVERWYEPLFP